MTGQFVVYGKSTNDHYSVRTAAGEPICTCAYNPEPNDRIETARMIADALNLVSEVPRLVQERRDAVKALGHAIRIIEREARGQTPDMRIVFDTFERLSK